MSDLEQENIKLKLEIKEVKKENEELKIKLKKYSNPDRNKKYYHTHKEELKKRNYKYNPTTPLVISKPPIQKHQFFNTKLNKDLS